MNAVQQVDNLIKLTGSVALWLFAVWIVVILLIIIATTIKSGIEKLKGKKKDE